MTDQTELDEQEQEGNPVEESIDGLPDQMVEAILAVMGVTIVDLPANEQSDMVFSCDEMDCNPVQVKVLACKKHKVMELYINFMGADPVGVIVQDGKVELIRVGQDEGEKEG